jgi:hypothetical protein
MKEAFSRGGFFLSRISGRRNESCLEVSECFQNGVKSSWRLCDVSYKYLGRYNIARRTGQSDFNSDVCCRFTLPGLGSVACAPDGTRGKRSPLGPPGFWEGRLERTRNNLGLSAQDAHSTAKWIGSLMQRQSLSDLE